MSVRERRPSKWDAVAQQVIADYHAGLPVVEISERNGIPQGTISNLLGKHGVVMNRLQRTGPSEQQIIRMYVRGRMSMYQIADRLGTSPNTVRRALDRHGVPVRDSGRYTPRTRGPVSGDGLSGAGADELVASVGGLLARLADGMAAVWLARLEQPGGEEQLLAAIVGPDRDRATPPGRP